MRSGRTIESGQLDSTDPIPPSTAPPHGFPSSASGTPPGRLFTRVGDGGPDTRPLIRIAIIVLGLNLWFGLVVIPLYHLRQESVLLPAVVVVMQLFTQVIAADAFEPTTNLIPGADLGAAVENSTAAHPPIIGYVDDASLLGTLPPPCEHTTVFAGAVCTASRRAGEVRGLLAWIASPAADDAIRRHGMLPARDAAPTTPDAKEPRA